MVSNLSSSVNLDLLRSVAVLCVYLAHAVRAANLARFGSLGRFGVILFFVHTSLVLMASLERLDLANPNQPGTVAVSFWIRRAFRIYPLSILCVVAVALFQVPSAPRNLYQWHGWGNLAQNIALVQNLSYSPDVLGVLWSLPLEVQMYVLLPLVYFFIRKGGYRSLLAWVLALAAALTLPHITERLSVFYFAPCFLAGVVAFELHKKIRPRVPQWLWPCAIALAIVLFSPLDNQEAAKLPRSWFLALGLAVLFPCCREIGAGLVARAAHLIAKYSYGIYLSHPIVFWVSLYVLSGTPWLVRIGVLITGSVLLPVAAYHLVEHPLIQAGALLADRLRPTQVEAAEAVLLFSAGQATPLTQRCLTPLACLE